MYFKKKILVIISLYWVLLLYILAALIWWFISLERQNNEMTKLRLTLKPQTHPTYTQLVTNALDLQKRKHAQYVGEGAIFMLVIIMGAIFMYRVMRRQWLISQQQQNFMMAITHELKTPISITRLNLETLRKRKLDTDTQGKLIDNTLQEADRLNDLCNNILLAFRLESGKFEWHKETMPLNELVKQSVARFTTLFPERIINVFTEENMLMHGDPLLIKILVNNLLENAIKYTLKQSLVTVKAFTLNNKYIITVADEGAGIPEDKRERVFEKFYRMGNESTRSAKGTGLGLYLCKKIAQNHQAVITVTDNIPQGCIFTVRFNKKMNL